MWSRKMRRLTQFPRILPAAGRSPLLSRPRPYSTTHETVVAIKNRASQTEPVASASDPSRPSSLDFDFGFDNWSEIDPVVKTIDTAAGKLPISPLLDPSWRKARLRKKKKIPPPKALSVRFQRRTAENVYAQFLAAPVRYCHNTKAHLPSSLLQSFGLVRHPETDQMWWIPGDFEKDPEDAPLRTDDVEDKSSATDADGIVTSNEVPPEHPTAEAAHEPVPADDVQLESTESQESLSPLTDAAPRERPTLETAAAESEIVAAGEAAGSQQEPVTTRNGKFFSPAYMVARQDLMIEFSEKKSKFSSGYMRFAINPSIGKLCKQATWRADMHEVVRDQMRRQIVGELAYLWRLCVESPGRDYLIKVNGQEDFRQEWNRFCCLSLDEGEREPFEILEAANTAARAVSVFDLPRLLGPESVKDLVSRVSLFQEAPFVVLKGQRTLQLRKRLWRLEGFVADYGQLAHNPALGLRSGLPNWL